MSCLPYGSFNGAPLNLGAFQYPQDGECYAGVITYHQTLEAREFFMVELTDPLVPGQTYFASFYANAAWGGYEEYPQLWVATSHIGMLFTMQSRQWEMDDPIPAPGNFAHIVHPWIIADTVDWVLVSGSFVADSAYQHVMIGNHFNDATTDTLHLGNSIQYAKAMTLIDNVCVSPNEKGCPLALQVANVALENVALFPNPATSQLVLQGLPPSAELMIFDAMGRAIWIGSSRTTAINLEVEEWPRGSYVLQVRDKHNSRGVRFMLI